MDAASLQILVSRLTGAADEMGAVLRRAAFSANIKERADCSAALFTANGELLVTIEEVRNSWVMRIEARYHDPAIARDERSRDRVDRPLARALEVTSRSRLGERAHVLLRSADAQLAR